MSFLKFSQWVFHHILLKINTGCKNYHIMASLGFIAPPLPRPPPSKFRSPLDTKTPGPQLIYLVGPLAISDAHINIYVGPLTLALL